MKKLLIIGLILLPILLSGCTYSGMWPESIRKRPEFIPIERHDTEKQDTAIKEIK